MKKVAEENLTTTTLTGGNRVLYCRKLNQSIKYYNIWEAFFSYECPICDPLEGLLDSSWALWWGLLGWGSSWASFGVVLGISWALLRHLGMLQDEYLDATALEGLLRCLGSSLESSWGLLGLF